jgi:hypothetical protein
MNGVRSHLLVSIIYKVVYVLQLIKLLFDLLFTLFGWITSFSSISGISELDDVWKGVLFTVAAIFCVIYGAIHIYEYWFQNRTTFKTQIKANEYLAKWIGTNTGHVLVYTNDISWASSGKLRKTLIRKARSGNLTLCLRRFSEEALALVQEGAKLFLLNGEPKLKARFIIVDYESDNPKVSIYTKDGRRHYVNQQYDGEQNPVVREVFIDLAKLATKGTAALHMEESPQNDRKS